MLLSDDEGMAAVEGCHIIELPIGRRNPLPDPERYARWHDLASGLEVPTHDWDTGA